MAHKVWRPVLAVVAVLALLEVTTVGVPAIAPAAASAEDNGVGLAPAMGWSSWSFLRTAPTAAKVEAEARAMVESGLSKVGYRYVNLDDFWYVCPGSQGPAVDRWGRWVPNRNFPPSSNGENGIKVVADYVHRLGLKFGLYVTPGISKQAVKMNTPILGPEGKPDGYTARQIAEPAVSEHNYNCGGMVGINYRARGAQDFIGSWADEFASWGVDYVKLDGVGSFDIPDVEAWSRALRQSGRPVHLELSNSLNVNYASVWEKYANGWRTGGDIECYSCETGGTSYPLTDWANVTARFNQAAKWRPYGEPGAFNDYDSIEVGNAGHDGLSVPERKTQLSLWALASSPLMLGTDLTHLGQTDLGLLEDTAVIAVDQDGIDARRVAETSTSQIFAKTERAGDVVVGLFNTGGRSALVSTTASKLGMPRCNAYEVDDLWSHQVSHSAGAIRAGVPSHGVALYRVTGVGGGRCRNA